ncbi:MAG: hypothetical protein KJO44_09475 [Gemmatimonadetes bacterium]|nr:hypothetical protein [Gemmatimonadota bacterium]
MKSAGTRTFSFARANSVMGGLVAAGYLLAAQLVGAMAAANAVAQEVVSASPDVTIALGGAPLTTADEDVVVDNRFGLFALETLGALPNRADVTAFGLELGGARLVAFDTTVELPGSVIARRGDVVRTDGASFSIVFDASAAGVPPGATTDAVSLAPSGLLLSFGTAVSLGGTFVGREDLVRWDGGSFSLAFDGSSEGVSGSLDVDGAQDLGGGSFLLSFDTTGEVGGVVFADEDILRFDGTSWSLEYDASSVDARWAAADLDAFIVPEPGFCQALLYGAVGLMAAARRRSCS